MGEQGEGMFFSLHGAYFTARAFGDSHDFEDRDRQAYSAGVGYRVRHRSGFFAEAGLGLAVQILHRSGVRVRPPNGPGFESFDQTLVRPGWIWSPQGLPDLDLAIGFEF